jgi:hypothetical protein
MTVYHKDLTDADLHSPKAHSTSHQDGGSDEISVAGLSGLLADAQKVTVRKNSGANVGTRKRLNLVEGTNITLTVADDATDDEVDVTITAAPFSTQNVVTASRAIGTVYQNTTGKTIFVVVTLVSTSGWQYAYTDASNPPTTIVAGVSYNSTAFTLAFMVLPNNYYKIGTSGSASLNYWVEWY